MAKYTSETLDLVFAALSDGTRRQVIAALSDGPACVSDLARPFDMALPSFLKHLDKLERAQLVTTTKRGRVRWVTLETDRLADAEAWIERYKSSWTRRLDKLARLAETLERTSS